MNIYECVQEYVYGLVHVSYAYGSQMTSVRYHSLGAINILIKFNFMCMGVLSAFLFMNLL